MNAVFSYSLALLLSTGGPAATSALAKREMQIVARIAAPPAIAAPAANPVATKSPAAPLRPSAVSVRPPAVATELSASPPTPAASINRPAWVDEPEGLRDGNSYIMHVVVGPEASRADCDRKLAAEIDRRVGEYVNEVMPRDVPIAVPQDIARLFPRMVTQIWEERIRWEQTELVNLHVQLLIDNKLRDDWEVQGLAALRSLRSTIVMFGYAGAIVVAAVGFVLLKWPARRLPGAGTFLPVVGVVAIIIAAVVLVKIFVEG
jgi:hypothetical protein